MFRSACRRPFMPMTNLGESDPLVRRQVEWLSPPKKAGHIAAFSALAVARRSVAPAQRRRHLGD